MKKLVLPLLLLAVISTAIASPGGGDPDPPAPPQTSALWGESGELWEPGTSRLRDFTTVGYMQGGVPIPDWPAGVNVTDFGAVPGDGLDDSQAFIDAITACPDFHAVFVPNGRYTILQQIKPNRDNFVLRGEDMYGTVLFCPKNLNEIHIQEIGYDPNAPDKRHTGQPKGFFGVEGGTHRSIENLSFEFREQRKMGHWEHKGADAIYYGNGVVDSWVRNICIKNSDHGVMMGGAQRISFLNMAFDHYIGRPDILGSSGITRWAGHIGINMGGARQCLFHNIEFIGKYFHDFDIINVPSGCVVSNVRGSNMTLHHHGQGANQNLYTNVDVGKGDRSLGGLMDSQRQSTETHWRIYGDQTLEPATVPLDTVKNHVFVGYDAGIPTTITDTLWYEAIEPAQLHPQNIYLAQMEHLGKPLPAGPPAPPLSQSTGDVIRINPVENNVVNASAPDTAQNPESKTLSPTNDIYFKFDLSHLNLASLARARLRVSSTVFKNTPFVLNASSVDDDSWSGRTLTYNNRPAAVAELDSIGIQEDSRAQQLEFDVTPFVQAQWSGDKVVSLVIRRTSGNGFLSAFRSRTDGLAPELILEQVESPVPGAPAAPTGMKTLGLIGNIRLDWPDNPEADVASYNVYRNAASAELKDYAEPIATGLVTSDFVDIDSVGDWAVGMMRSDRTYFYRITAVDSHGYESPSSTEFVGTTLDSVNNPPAFNSDTVVPPNAMESEAYTASLATSAADPESDPLYFFKIDGPDWLHIAYDGTLSGTPQLSDSGINRFTVQVNAMGGRDEAVVEILVDAGTIVPGPPAIPSGFVAKAGNGAVFLVWAESEDIDFKSYRLYRSLQSGSYGPAVAERMVNIRFLDLEVENGVTYFYTLRAVDKSGNVSLLSQEVAATPSPDNTVNVADYAFTGRVLTSSDADSMSTASNLREGGGLSIGYETRTWGDPGNFGNPPPSLKWTNSNANNGIILDDDYLSFSVSAGTENLKFHSLSFDEKGAGEKFSLFTSQDGFASMEAVIAAPRTTTTAGIVNTHTIWLNDLAEISPGESSEFRIYINTTSTIGESWIDNIRLTRIVDSGATSFIQTCPTGLAASAAGGEIQLDWGDHPGPALAGYTIFRSTESGSYNAPMAIGVSASEFSDDTALGGIRYYYVASAVNTLGVASTMSAEVSAIASAPTPRFIADPMEKSNAAVGRNYYGGLSNHVSGGNLSGLSFARISGPDWLSVDSSGQLSGRPGTGDAGVNTWTIEVSDGVGTDQASLQIVVSLNADHDADGIDDNWEDFHFGSWNAIDGSLDSDGDGVADFFEYLGGSAPKDPANGGFQITAKAGPAGTGTVFTWGVLQGFSLGTDYEAWVSPNLSHWNRLTHNDYQLDENTQGGVTNVELRLTADPGANAFLRLQQP